MIHSVIRRSSVGFFLLLAVGVWGEDFTPPRYELARDSVEVKRSTNNAYWNTGERFGARHKKVSSPKEVMGIVTMKNGQGRMTFQSASVVGKRNVQPTTMDSSSISLTPKLIDSTMTPNSYGWSMSADKKALVITSSDANDSGTVYVRVLGR